MCVHTHSYEYASEYLDASSGSGRRCQVECVAVKPSDSNGPETLPFGIVGELVPLGESKPLTYVQMNHNTAYLSLCPTGVRACATYAVRSSDPSKVIARKSGSSEKGSKEESEMRESHG